MHVCVEDTYFCFCSLCLNCKLFANLSRLLLQSNSTSPLLLKKSCSSCINDTCDSIRTSRHRNCSFNCRRISVIKKKEKGKINLIVLFCLGLFYMKKRLRKSIRKSFIEHIMLCYCHNFYVLLYYVFLLSISGMIEQRQ